MFETLSNKLQNVFKNLRGLGKISESNISDSLRDVRMALLDADVNFAPSASLGARIRIVEGLALQAEGRLHGIEPDFAGTVMEITGGVVISF